jgi:hypothetical protein
MSTVKQVLFFFLKMKKELAPETLQACWSALFVNTMASVQTSTHSCNG